MENKVEIVSCETIMNTEYPPARFCVDTLIGRGCYLVAGVPKIGKSKLALNICISVAKGESALGLKTEKGSALYLALEDPYERLQNRLYELLAEGRDIVNRKMELQLEKESQRWKVIADDLVEPEKFDDEVVTAIAAVMKQEVSFLDTATVLTEKVNKLTKKEYEPRLVSRIMTQNRTRLEDLGILFKRRHSNGKRIDKITARDIQKFITGLMTNGANMKTGKPLSRKTAIHHLNLISDVFTYAIRMGMLCDNPCRRVFVPKMEHEEKEIFTIDQVKTLFEGLHSEPTKFQVYLQLAVYSGFRRSEMLGLEWKDIDFENELIHIRRTSQYTAALGIYTDTTKTKKSKRVSKMPTEIMDLLRYFKEEQKAEAARLGSKWEDHDRLFTKWNGAPMSPQTPFEWLKGYCERMNVPFHNIHSLRHLHASLLIFEGVDVVAVSADMGHSEISTTRNMYSHMFQEAKARSCDAISNALNFSKPPKKPTMTKCKCYELPFSGAHEA